MKHIAKIESISYSIMNGIAVGLSGFPHLQFIKPENIKFGGQNCEIGDLRVGGKILFDYDTVSAVRDLGVVTIISDGIREVDTEGKLIKW